MFSKGNVAEKARFAQLIEPNEVVVDLFAGIGYFTVSALVLSPNCRLLHACEWNPDAVRALRINLRANHVDHRCEVHPGDCRLLDLQEGADRVSLGLLPSSRVGWETAVRCLKSQGGWLHVHENVPETDAEKFATYLEKELAAIALRGRESEWSCVCRNIQKVKSYAPRVFHYVFDMECRPLEKLSETNLTSSANDTAILETLRRTQFNPTSLPRFRGNHAEHVADLVQRAGDELLCMTDRFINIQEARSIAASAELRFRRLRRVIDQNY